MSQHSTSSPKRTPTVPATLSVDRGKGDCRGRLTLERASPARYFRQDTVMHHQSSQAESDFMRNHSCKYRNEPAQRLQPEVNS